MSGTKRHFKAHDDRIYTDNEFAFLQAIDAWKQEHGHPTVTDYLHIAESIGYRRRQLNYDGKRLCWRCKQKPAHYKSGDCRECHNAYNRQWRMKQRMKEFA